MKQYDAIKLKDGRKGTIVEVLNNGEAFIVDIDIIAIDGSVSWKTVEINKNDILY